MERTTVLIVEDHPLYREALAGSVQSFGDQLELVGQTGSADEAIRWIEELVPDVVLLDLELNRRREAGAEIISKIRLLSPKTKVLVVTGYSEEDLIFQAIKAGALGYILKDSLQRQDVLSLIEQVQSGNPPLDPLIAKKLLSYFQSSGDAEATVRTKLTKREEEIVELVVKGWQNKEIAAQLNISIKTVKTHLQNIYEKLHLSNRTELRFLVKAKGLPPA